MKSLAIISIAIVAAAFAGHHEGEMDNKPQCQCDQMKTCLEGKLKEHDQERTRCDQHCANKLPHHEQMETCMKAKWQKSDEMLEKMLVCVTTGDHNVCRPGQNHESADRNKTEEEKGKSEMIDEFKPYVECMKTCMNMSAEEDQKPYSDKMARPHHEPAHGWQHFTRQMWGGLKMCKKTLGCKLDHDTKMESVTKCMKSTGVNKDAYCTMKKNFCKCARGVMGKTEQEMPCNWDGEHTEEPHGHHTTAAHGHA